MTMCTRFQVGSLVAVAIFTMDATAGIASPMLSINPYARLDFLGDIDSAVFPPGPPAVASHLVYQEISVAGPFEQKTVLGNAHATSSSLGPLVSLDSEGYFQSIGLFGEFDISAEGPGGFAALSLYHEVWFSLTNDSADSSTLVFLGEYGLNGPAGANPDAMEWLIYRWEVGLRLLEPIPFPFLAESQSHVCTPFVSDYFLPCVNFYDYNQAPVFIPFAPGQTYDFSFIIDVTGLAAIRVPEPWSISLLFAGLSIVFVLRNRRPPLLLAGSAGRFYGLRLCRRQT